MYGFLQDTICNHSANRQLKEKRKNLNILYPGDIVIIPDKRLKEESGATEQRHSFKQKSVPDKLILRVIERVLRTEYPANATESVEDSENLPSPGVEEEDSLEADDYDDNDIEEQTNPDEQSHSENQETPIEEESPYEVRPLANTPFVLAIDGDLIKNTTDADGWLECRILPNAKEGRFILNPGTPKEVIYKLKLGHLDPLSEISGVQHRLNNLGFDCGATDGVLGPKTRSALRRFQKHHRLPETGEPDEATRSKLFENHGS